MNKIQFTLWAGSATMPRDMKVITRMIRNFTGKWKNTIPEMISSGAGSFIIKRVLRTSTMSKYLIKFSLLQWRFVTANLTLENCPCPLSRPCTCSIFHAFLSPSTNNVLRRYQARNLNSRLPQNWLQRRRHCNVTRPSITVDVVCQRKFVLFPKYYCSLKRISFE